VYVVADHDCFVQIQHGRVRITGSLTGFIMTAYHMKNYQIVGAPDWVDGLGRPQYFDITFAKASRHGPELDQVPETLQALLTDRFGLKFRRETKETFGYNLVIGEHGPLFAAGPVGVQIKHIPITLVSSRRYTKNLSMEDLVFYLYYELHNPVRDKTGVSGIFDFNESIFIPPAEALFSEVQEELGLKLIPATESMEILEIEHAQLPRYRE
jgi:uncharacterized protein (TIGR03435 family)